MERAQIYSGKRAEGSHARDTMRVTHARDAQGRSIAMTPLLDRPVTIPPGVRRINESAALMAAIFRGRPVCE